MTFGWMTYLIAFFGISWKHFFVVVCFVLSNFTYSLRLWQMLWLIVMPHGHGNMALNLFFKLLSTKSWKSKKIFGTRKFSKHFYVNNHINPSILNSTKNMVLQLFLDCHRFQRQRDLQNKNEIAKGVSGKKNFSQKFRKRLATLLK